MGSNIRSSVAQTQQLSRTARNRNALFQALRHHLLRDWVAVLLFGLIAALTMLPVVPDMRTRELGGAGDIHLYTYMTGWMAQGVALGISPFVDPRTNFPDGLTVTATDEPYLAMLILAPVTLALGATLSYNLIMLIGAWLSGYVCFLWVRHISDSWAGGIIAGLAFVLAPSRMVHSFGHLALMCTFVVPLFFWMLDNALQAPQPSVRRLLALFVATFILGATSQYMLTLCLVIGVIYTLLIVLPKLRYLIEQGWKIALSVVAGAAISLIPDLLNAGRSLYRPYLLSDIRHWAADPINFVLPSQIHPFWGSIIERLRPEPLWGEKTLYIGAVAAAFAVVALASQTTPNKKRLWVWFGAALSAAIFALGHDLYINNQPLQPENPVLLPAAYLAQLPFMSVIRVWPRFGIIVSLFIACLAGMGVAHMVRRFPRWPVLGIAGSLILLDFMPPMPITTRMEPRPVEQWLSKQPGDFAVAFLPPAGPGEDAANYVALFGSLFHGKQLPAFNHPFHRSNAYMKFEKIASSFPDQAAIEQLRSMGLRYLLLETNRFNGETAPGWSDVQAQMTQWQGTRIVTEQDGIVVVELK